MKQDTSLYLTVLLSFFPVCSCCSKSAEITKIKERWWWPSDKEIYRAAGTHLSPFPWQVNVFGLGRLCRAINHKSGPVHRFSPKMSSKRIREHSLHGTDVGLKQSGWCSVKAGPQELVLTDKLKQKLDENLKMLQLSRSDWVGCWIFYQLLLMSSLHIVSPLRPLLEELLYKSS